MTIPTELGHYRILEPLGKGGMGEVFAAEDTRLRRKVAIKVLSGLMASDDERRQRFAREAQAIAALNHPNIVTIHAVEEAAGVPFIVMELVEGRPLADLIKAGGLPLDTLLRIGVAVSDAVGAAHLRGITHRDLKPANVMVWGDGRVKVLDFGLAKLREAEAEYDGETRLPAGDLTGEGRIIGTVAYMSPEQPEGKPVDQRSDIFSLGVMLHEMALGEPPFKGDTNVSIISAILKDTPPPVTDLRPGLPPRIGRIIRRSLSKDPSRRYQTAIDLRNDLEELKQDLDSGGGLSTVSAVTSEQRRPRHARWLPMSLAALALFAVAGAFWALRHRQEGKPDFQIRNVDRLTASGTAQLVAISKDGRYVVHVKSDGDRPSLWVRQTSTSSDVQIVPPSDLVYAGMAFSPDGDYVYYTATKDSIGSLHKIPVLGGVPQQLIRDVDSGLTFSPDGTRLAFIRHASSEGRTYLMTASASGDDVQKLTSANPPDHYFFDLAWSPDGQVILVPGYTIRDGAHGACFAVNAATGQTTEVAGRWASVTDVEWMPDGQSYIVAAVGLDSGESLRSQLWQVSYPEGTRHRVTADLNNYRSTSMTQAGTTIAAILFQTETALWVTAESVLSGGARVAGDRISGVGVEGLDWTPDRHIVFTSAASGSPQIWIANADGSGARQVTSGGLGNRHPNVSPNGTSIAFQQTGSRLMSLARIPIEGGASSVLATGELFFPKHSPDGKWIYYTDLSSGAARPYRVAAAGGVPQLLASPGHTNFAIADVSHDGSRLLGMVVDEKAQRIRLALMPSVGGAVSPLDAPDVSLVSSAIPPAFGREANTVEYLVGTSADTAGMLDYNLMSSAALWRLSLADGKTQRLTDVTDGIFGWSWSPDGQKLLLARGKTTSDVVILTRSEIALPFSGDRREPASLNSDHVQRISQHP